MNGDMYARNWTQRHIYELIKKQKGTDTDETEYPIFFSIQPANFQPLNGSRLAVPSDRMISMINPIDPDPQDPPAAHRALNFYLYDGGLPEPQYKSVASYAVSRSGRFIFGAFFGEEFPQSIAYIGTRQPKSEYYYRKPYEFTMYMPSPTFYIESDETGALSYVYLNTSGFTNYDGSALLEFYQTEGNPGVLISYTGTDGNEHVYNYTR